MDKVHVYMCFHMASINSPAVNKIRPFPSPFLTSTSWFLILAKAFRNDHVAVYSTALRSATEKNNMGGYVTIPCSPKMTQRSRQWIGLNSSDATRLFTTEQLRNK